MKNKVELINYTGGDKAHARAAWASTNTDVENIAVGDILIYKSMYEPLKDYWMKQVK